jgi:Protein of unknown function (DUF2384)
MVWRIVCCLVVSMDGALSMSGFPSIGDLPLLDGENADIRQEAIDVVGEEWLTAPNAYFGGATPDDVIDSGHVYLVRNSLRIIRHVGFS